MKTSLELDASAEVRTNPTARKELEAAFQGDSDSETDFDDGVLNLGDEEGQC